MVWNYAYKLECIFLIHGLIFTVALKTKNKRILYNKSLWFLVGKHFCSYVVVIHPVRNGFVRLAKDSIF